MPDATPATPPQVYRPTTRRRGASLITLIFCLLFFGLPLILLLYPAIGLLVNEPMARPIVAGAICCLAPLAGLILLLLAQVVLSAWAMCWAHELIISDAGLEYRFWPYYHIHCDWQEVDRIGKHFLFSDALYLRSYEIIGASLALTKGWRVFNPAAQNFIILSGLSGWPNGLLATGLRRYAPQLFDAQTGKPAAGRLPPDTCGHSQSERQNAALAHAGALICPVFVPLAFWLAERKKSAYVAFQAWQALVFQVIMLALFCASFICVLSGLLAPVGLTQLTDRVAISGPTFGLILLVAFILGGLFSFAGVLMLLYSAVAAARTYQGADFRYPLIGGWLAKHYSFDRPTVQLPDDQKKISENQTLAP